MGEERIAALESGLARSEERIGTLEKGLLRLEAAIEKLVYGMDVERAATTEARREVWAALASAGEKMERSIEALTNELKLLAQKNTDLDARMIGEKARAQGALSTAGWCIATALTVIGLFIAYQATLDAPYDPKQNNDSAALIR